MAIFTRDAPETGLRKWETYERQRQGGLGSLPEPTVSVQRAGQVVLNQKAYDLLGSPAKVRLLFDRELRIIGLSPAMSTEGTAMKVSPGQSLGTYQLTAAGVLSMLGWLPKEATRLPAQLVDGILEIQF